MTPRVLLDSGPLVAAFDRRDRHYAWTTAQLTRLTPPFLTCESVLSESCFLLRHVPQSTQGIMALLARGSVVVPFHLEEEHATISRLLTRYADVPMSLADACLVRMAEIHDDAAVFTLDRDFRIYRKHGRQVIPTIMPDGLP